MNDANGQDGGGTSRNGAKTACKFGRTGPERESTTPRPREKSRAALLQLAQTGSWSWEIRTGELWWSSESFRILGLDPGLSPGGRVFISRVHPDDRTSVLRWVAQAARNGVTPCLRFRVRWPGGVTRHVLVHGRIVLAPDGYTVDHAEGTMMDVSEQREHDVHTRRIEKMAALGTLAGGIAHDYNNFLQVITGNVELLAQLIPESGDAHECLQEIAAAAVDCTELTSRLSSFGRRQWLGPAPVHVPDLLSTLAPRLRAHLGETIDLVIVREPGRAFAKIDVGGFEQILFHMCQNASDAMHGCGELRVETGEVVIGSEYSLRSAGLQPGPYLRLVVADQGSGMSPEVVSRVFEPFFSTKQRRRGRGLGLATCYGIVDQSGGAIEVESREGVGSRFKIYLPLAEVAQERPGGQDRHAGPVDGQGRTVLLVDDEAQVRRVARRVLERGDFQVVEAQDGEQALALLAELPEVCVLVSDVVMPGMDGVALLRHARKLRPELGCVLMSGYACVDDGQQPDELGDRVALHKPFTLTELLSAVGEALAPLTN